MITEAGFGPAFMHRTGHGIGVEEHEDPYIVGGNDLPLAPGHAFSIEPGIYLEGRFGLPARGHRGRRRPTAPTRSTASTTTSSPSRPDAPPVLITMPPLQRATSVSSTP